LTPNLGSVIERIRRKKIDGDNWLYIVGSAQRLTLETEADLGCPEFDEGSDEEITPVGFAKRGLQSTIDVQTVEECIEWADRLSGSKDSKAVLDVIRYYICFDAFPERLNSPDPPPRDEILRRIDREFCDKLGAENFTQKCRSDGCDRGAVKFSLYCRHHHFENVQKRDYPFED